MKNDYAVLILSCDKYSDTWYPFFSSYSKFWKYDKTKIYLVTNNIEFNGVINLTTIKTGDETSWSSKVRIALKSICEKYILVLLDDYFLIDNVSTDEIRDLYTFIESDNVDYLCLIPSQKKNVYKDNISMISKKNLYGKTLQPAFWRKDYFQSCLYNDDFSAWEFENRQKFDSDLALYGKDCCTNKKIIRFTNEIGRASCRERV